MLRLVKVSTRRHGEPVSLTSPKGIIGYAMLFDEDTRQMTRVDLTGEQLNRMRDISLEESK